MPVAVLSALIRPLVEPHLPPEIEPRWYTSVEEMHSLAPEAEIGWFDLDKKEPMIEAVRLAGKLRWLNSIYAGLDFLPLDLLAERGVMITNGAGINAITIAEYVVMLMLTHAKGYRQVVRAQDRHDETALGADRDADVVVVLIDDVSAVDLGVHRRDFLERLHAGAHEEAHEAELGAVLLLE